MKERNEQEKKHFSGEAEGRRGESKLPPSPFLYAILDRSVVAPEAVKQSTRHLLDGGVDIIQYRAKDLPLDLKRKDLEDIISMSKQFRVPLIVNDDPYLAGEMGAEGVHLGETDESPDLARTVLGPEAIIGCTIHRLDQVRKLKGKDIDYLSAGAIFDSPTKPGVKTVGTDFLARVREKVDITLVAIGGITPDNARQVIHSGADGIAPVSALLGGNISRNCFTFKKIIDKKR